MAMYSTKVDPALARECEICGMPVIWMQMPDGTQVPYKKDGNTIERFVYADIIDWLAEHGFYLEMRAEKQSARLFYWRWQINYLDERSPEKSEHCEPFFINALREGIVMCLSEKPFDRIIYLSLSAFLEKWLPGWEDDDRVAYVDDLSCALHNEFENQSHWNTIRFEVDLTNEEMELCKTIYNALSQGKTGEVYELAKDFGAIITSKYRDAIQERIDHYENEMYVEALAVYQMEVGEDREPFIFTFNYL